MKDPQKEFGRLLDFQSYKGRINPDFYLPEFAKKMSEIEHLLRERSHQTLLNGRNRIRVIPFPLSEGRSIDIVVKEFFPKGLNRMKTILLPSKAAKAWRGGIALVERNLLTPVPVAYLEKRRILSVKENIYFSIHEKEAEEIRFLFRRSSSEELESLIRSLARHLRRCHEKGILHRDLSDGNILVKKNVRGDYGFYLIDTNRIRVKKRLGFLKRIKNLTRLGVPKTCQRLFLLEYSLSGKVGRWTWIWYRSCKNAYVWHIRLKRSLYTSKGNAAGKLA